MSEAQTAGPIPEAPADEEVETLSDERLQQIRDNDDNGMAARVMAGELLIARAVLRRSTETNKPGVREAALEEAAKLVEGASPIRPAFVTEDEGGIQWPHPAQQMPIYGPEKLAAAIRALSASPLTEEQPVAKFKLGDRVRKTKGSAWRGHVVGTYSTELTPEGYSVESENEPGSVQLYPAAALEALPRSTTGGAK